MLMDTCCMTRFGMHARLNRLDGLNTLLADGQTHHVCDLAQSLAVSERTVARDLALLRTRGVQLDSDPGRGGGVRLSAHSATAAVLLRESEAIELLLAVTVSEVLGTRLGGRMDAVRSALVRGFAPADRARISQLRRRIWVASPVSSGVGLTKMREAPASRAALQQAFFAMRHLQFQYEDGCGKFSQREVEAQYLLWAWPFWYLLCWDTQRHAVRTFRLDRVRNAQVLASHFHLRPAALFKDAINGVGSAL
jgi:predicted DNA-binding transcriptional regulator YafY